jgi:hypothetical protein
VAAFELVLRRPNRPDRICRRKRGAEVGDVLFVDGRPWVVIEKETPSERRLLERLICVPRKVRAY